MKERCDGNMKYAFRCIKCGFVNEIYFNRCPKCHFIPEVYFTNLTWKTIRSRGDMWRYMYLLPTCSTAISLGEGVTPLRRVGEVFIKDETRNPTRSYMDRGSALLVNYLNIPKEVTVSYIQDFTSSISLYLTKAGIKVSVLVDPLSVDPLELLYIASLDVNISFVKDMLSENRSMYTYEDPLVIEGLKTISYELHEQCRKINIEGVVVPSESGILAFSIAKGYRELKLMGVLENVPELILAVSRGLPAPEMLKYIKEMKVRLETVDDEEVLRSMVFLAKRGVYVKPVSAMAYAVAENLGKRYVAIISGSSLRRMYRGGLSALTSFQKRIIDVLSREGELTAYQLWKRMDEYTLQAVYKALSKLSSLGLVDREIRMIGDKKISYYRIRYDMRIKEFL